MLPPSPLRPSPRGLLGLRQMPRQVATSLNFKLLLVGVLCAAGVTGVQGLACKMCLSVVGAIESGGSDAACDVACSELDDFPLCTDLCGYVLDDLIEFIKNELNRKGMPARRSIMVTRLRTHACVLATTCAPAKLHPEVFLAPLKATSIFFSPPPPPPNTHYPPPLCAPSGCRCPGDLHGHRAVRGSRLLLRCVHSVHPGPLPVPAQQL